MRPSTRILGFAGIFAFLTVAVSQVVSAPPPELAEAQLAAETTASGQEAPGHVTFDDVWLIRLDPRP